jgi:hypothetical protein
MTNLQDFVTNTENELRCSGKISASTCEEWEHLPAEAHAAHRQAMIFLGCPEKSAGIEAGSETPEPDRVTSARLMLLKLGLHTSDPKWSSTVLTRLLKSIKSTPGGRITDLIHALYKLLGEPPYELSKPRAAFIKALAIRSFLSERSSFESIEWSRFAQDVNGVATKPQLYLALYVLPMGFISDTLAEVIIKGLESTPYHREAQNLLAA